jgi:integrase
MLGKMKLSTIKGKRDKALLLLGFFTASRRSELSELQAEDLQETIEGLTVTIRRSKTDQEGRGLVKAVTRQDNPDFCPVRALQDYTTAAGITTGPVFREVTKGGQVGETALTGRSIARLVKDAAGKAKLNKATYSGHSLRAGLVTTAAKEGASMAEIMAQTGHKSTDTVARYIRKARLFDDAVTRRIKL